MVPHIESTLPRHRSFSVILASHCKQPTVLGKPTTDPWELQAQTTSVMYLSGHLMHVQAITNRDNQDGRNYRNPIETD